MWCNNAIGAFKMALLKHFNVQWLVLLSNKTHFGYFNAPTLTSSRTLFEKKPFQDVLMLAFYTLIRFLQMHVYIVTSLILKYIPKILLFNNFTLSDIFLSLITIFLNRNWFNTFYRCFKCLNLFLRVSLIILFSQLMIKRQSSIFVILPNFHIESKQIFESLMIGSFLSFFNLIQNTMF